MENFYNNAKLQNIFMATKILRKPIIGIISGYHELPYILVAPDDKNPSHAVEISGLINVSPKFIISAAQLSETFGQVFDPETFDQDIHGRVFSFANTRRKNINVHNGHFSIKNIEEKPDELIQRILDRLMMEENLSTGLIFGPLFRYYPISLDRFINEILDREFRV